MEKSNIVTLGKYRIDLLDLPKLAKKSATYYKELAKRINRISDNQSDKIINALHHAFFESFDCLQCANCCRGLGPRLTSRDIDRVASQMRLKPGAFTEKYLRIDEDNDYVFKTMPCPLINTANECAVYGQHPKACSEYPHTQQIGQRKIFHLTVQNAAVCPVVYCILQELNNKLP